MNDIDRIIYDQNYSGRSSGMAIIHKRGEQSMIIPLPNAQLMTYLKRFNDGKDADSHISKNHQCSFQLYADGYNVCNWPCIKENRISSLNLEQIRIYCLTSEEQRFYERWARRYPQIVEVIIVDKLNRDLLVNGLRLIENLRFEIEEDSIKNLIQQDYNQIIRALDGTYSKSIDIADRDIATGVEAS